MNLPTPEKPWILERGDSLDFMRSLPDSCIDAVITDPPYCSGGTSSADRAKTTTQKYVQSGVKVVRPDFAGDNRDQRSWLVWCDIWMREALRVAKPGAPICVFTDWRQLPSTTDAIQVSGWIWRGIAVWDKTEGARPQRGRFRNQAEYIVWGSSGQMAARDEIGVLPGVFRHYLRQADKHHITGKPTEVMRGLVQICPAGGVILDPFAGSGTTGAAALAEGRRFVGVEREQTYFDIATARLKAAW